MVISRLRLRLFRNIDTLELLPADRMNVLWGDNAQGKTNILEAIYLLGALKSFRAAGNEDLVGHGRDACRLEAEVKRFENQRRLTLTVTRQGKKVALDNQEVYRPADYFGHLQAVLFAPEEIGQVKGGPAGRRALLDRAIFQTDTGYLNEVKNFDRHLRQRNRLLRDAALPAELAPWTDGLIRSGALVRHRRYQYLERLRPRFQEAYRRISGGTETADLAYSLGGDDRRKLEAELERELGKAADREHRLGQTLAGPHRDDVDFAIEGRSLRLFGSQGQQRSFLLAFKTAQVQDLQETTGEPPVLLLDDMTSELDGGRQNFFFRYLSEASGQVFITTTDAAPLRAQGFPRARFFRISGGGLQHDEIQG